MNHVYLLKTNHERIVGGKSMNRIIMTHLKRSFLVLILTSALMVFVVSALAGDSMMQQNCKNLSELTSKWSTQLASGKITPEAQAKLAELLAETSQILQEMSEKSGEQMHMQNSVKIEGMQKAWDPFDTSGKM
jgi:cell division protein FtsB